MGCDQEGISARELSVSHIAFSSSGGAGSVARLLNQTLLEHDVRSELVSLTDGKINDVVKTHPKVFAAAYFDYLAIRRRGAGLFTSLRAQVRSDVDVRHDVIHVHWLPGVLRIEDLFAVKKNVVLTLHDYWLVTGGCHFPNGCVQYMTDCAKCPQARAPFQSRVKRQHKSNQQLIGENSASLQLTAPSQSLASQAQAALELPVTVIRNPIENCFFDPVVDRDRGDSSRIQIALVAADLGDPRKGVRHFLQAVQSMTENDKKRLHLHFVGGNAPRCEGVANSDHGYLKDASSLARVLDRMDVVAVPSIDDNSPLVVGQALARGCFVLASNAGGTDEVLTQSSFGRSFGLTESEIADSISYCLEREDKILLHRIDRHRHAVNLFSPTAVIEDYIALYRSF